MDRRDFIRMTLASGLLHSAGVLPAVAAPAKGGFPTVGHRVLAKLMLPGGPDMRHIIVPPYEAGAQTYGYNYWQARARAHGIADTASAWQQRWNNDFTAFSHGATQFGIHNDCGWLQQLWQDGKLAIVSNVYGGSSRDHANCIDIIEQGVQSFAPNEPYRAGWGGRLADIAGGPVASLTVSPRTFCYGPATSGTATYGTGNIVSAANVRAMTLYRNPEAEWPLTERAVITRGVQSYYAAKGQEMDPDSLYSRFTEMEQTLRAFGEPIDERLASLPLPPAIEALQYGGSNESNFGQQVANVHDVFATFDILSPRVVSLEYSGSWDSHSGQREAVEPLFADLFGSGRTLDVMFSELPPNALDNLVLVIAGEFGRQLRDNGDNGTDHGEGNCMLVIGNNVAGGVYGDLFPEAELERLNDDSPQIEGLTAIDHLFGAVCDWVSPGSGNGVFPERAGAPLESGVSFDGLLV
ncbi:MAG: DUF1501 domain-containing protein [Pseudomonadota bacterium]